MALGTALAWGGTGSFAKLIAAGGVSQITVVCYRGLFAAAVAGAFMLARRGAAYFRCPRAEFAQYLMLGAFTILFNATGYMMSCVYLSVPQVLMLNYTFPIVTMAGSAFINGERPSALQVLSGFLVLAGLYVGFAAGGADFRSISPAGVAWSMLSVAGLSGNALLSRRISAKADPLKQLFYSHLTGALMLIAIRSLAEGWPDLALITPEIFLYMQYPAIFAALVGYGLLFSALRCISAPLASMICTMEIVFAAALTPLIAGEVPPLHEIAGCAVIAGAVVVSILSERGGGNR